MWRWCISISFEFHPSEFLHCQIFDSCYYVSCTSRTPKPPLFIFIMKLLPLQNACECTLSELCMLTGNQHCLCYQDRHLTIAFSQSLEKHVEITVLTDENLHMKIYFGQADCWFLCLHANLLTTNFYAALIHQSCIMAGMVQRRNAA